MFEPKLLVMGFLLFARDQSKRSDASADRLLIPRSAKAPSNQAAVARFGALLRNSSRSAFTFS